MLADSPLASRSFAPTMAEALKLVGIYYYRVWPATGGPPYYEKSYAIVQDLAAARRPTWRVRGQCRTSPPLAIAPPPFAWATAQRGAAMLAEARLRAEATLTAKPAERSRRKSGGRAVHDRRKRIARPATIRSAQHGPPGGLRLYDELAKAVSARLSITRGDVAMAYYTLGRVRFDRRESGRRARAFRAGLEDMPPGAGGDEQGQRSPAGGSRAPCRRRWDRWMPR
jgi:hypothetical protein